MRNNRIFPMLFKGNKRNKIKTDPQGSYTGRPEDKDDVPVQDADDL